MVKTGWFLLCSFVLLMACGKLDVYERNVSIPAQKWNESFTPEFSFLIKDTVASYRLDIVLRHTDAYAYRNIWLQFANRQPGDSTFTSERVELPLQHEGQWLGTGLSDILELRYPLLTNAKFPKPGTYTFRIGQIMREDPLEHVMSIGVRVEKTHP